MKLKTTKKEMEQYPKIARIGYCEAQHLLKYNSPFAYSKGIYGWNGDYYEVEGVLIATGYRSLPESKNTKCSYDIVRKFDDLAMGKSREETDVLLKDFIAEITK